MDRRAFLFSSAAAAVVGTPALADKISLNALSGYLNGISAAAAEFTQVNDDGTLATGQLMLQRPGRMRFEYDSPEDTLVIAGQGQIAIFDGRSNVPDAEKYPLNQTPLKLILERTVNLARRNMVVGHDFDGSATVVVAQDPERPEYGSISLKFTGDPIELRQWVVTDGQGATTTVILGKFEKRQGFSPRLFDIKGEEKRRSG